MNTPTQGNKINCALDADKDNICFCPFGASIYYGIYKDLEGDKMYTYDEMISNDAWYTK